MSAYLKAMNAKNDEHIPVWFMRQAGRYLPEYMNLKGAHDFKTRTHTPELVKTISLQPLERYPLDAIILFSDILTCLEFMGAEFDFSMGGPKLDKAGVNTLKSLKALNIQDLNFVIEGIKSIKAAMPEKPLIGFCGAPFTMASYVIEGGTSKEFIETRKMMFSDEGSFVESMNLLADSIADYLIYQVQSGAQAVQLFDSWVGILSEAQYKKLILPNMQRLISRFKKQCGDTPFTLYSQPSLHLLPLLCETGANTLSLDWRSPVKKLAKIIDASGKTISLQGNLDPILTTQDFSIIRPYVDQILKDVTESGYRNKFIFNVGHGVNPQTKPESIGKIIDHVHQFK